MIPDWMDAKTCRFVRIEALRFAREHLNDWRRERFGFQRRMARHSLNYAAECRRAERARHNQRKAA